MQQAVSQEVLSIQPERLKTSEDVDAFSEQNLIILINYVLLKWQINTMMKSTMRITHKIEMSAKKCIYFASIRSSKPLIAASINSPYKIYSLKI